jgi:O-6-methylguanine DNA methyltransferase
MKHFIELPITTRDGKFLARYSEKGLAELNFPKSGRAELPLGPAVQQRRPARQPVVPAKISRWHRVTESALKRVLAGQKSKTLPPLDWSDRTEFQKAVWREMRKIYPGKTKSYGEIAERIGKPKAVRAVGGACGANPIPVLVPCHRVLAANKKLGGFSGGLAWKRKLLAQEGIKI